MEQRPQNGDHRDQIGFKGGQNANKTAFPSQQFFSGFILSAWDHFKSVCIFEASELAGEPSVQGDPFQVNGYIINQNLHPSLNRLP